MPPEGPEAAELLASLGPALIQELDQHKIAQTITDIATQVAGAEFGAFFHNMVNDRGEAYKLYTVSGASKDAFSHMPMPRITAVFAPTFGGGPPVRSDDITQDPRYGRNAPHGGMPKGHLPVRSYLALSVVSRTGEVLGGILLAHSEPGRFNELHERLAAGVAAHAAIAMDIARSHEHARWLQNQLARATQSLRRAHADLEAVAAFAEREPRMKGLAEYLGAVRPVEGEIPRIPSLSVLEATLAKSHEEIEKAGGTVTHMAMPEVSMHEIHLEEVFRRLIHNALRFRGAIAPRVHVSATQEDSFTIFSVQDKGLGIPERQFAEVFAWKQDRVGLAICRRIVEQYGGRIWVAESKPGVGSTFSFSIPDRP